MPLFVQKIKADVLEITHKFVNHMEIKKRSKSVRKDLRNEQHLECELASSRLILYASNWLNHLAEENITADKRAFYIDSENVKECCEILERSPLYQRYSIFSDIVSLIKRLQRVKAAQNNNQNRNYSFSLSG